MHLKDFARRLPDEVWELFEPLLPAVVWCGNGRKPKANRDCFHALLYVLGSVDIYRRHTSAATKRKKPI